MGRLVEGGGLRKRELPVSPALSQMRGSMIELWKTWEEAQLNQFAAMNFLLDPPGAQRPSELRKFKAEENPLCLALNSTLRKTSRVFSKKVDQKR